MKLKTISNTRAILQKINQMNFWAHPLVLCPSLLTWPLYYLLYFAFFGFCSAHPSHLLTLSALRLKPNELQLPFFSNISICDYKVLVTVLNFTYLFKYYFCYLLVMSSFPWLSFYWPWVVLRCFKRVNLFGSSALIV